MNVVVTGASAGIGAATATAFARRGHSVGLIARRRDLLERIASDLPSAHVAVADVGEAEQIHAALTTLRGAMGDPDVLVNNAGMPGGAPFAELSVEEIERVTAVNLMSAIWATREVLPAMVRRGSGTIVNVASIAGRIGVPRAGAYCGSKFGLAGFSDSLALELAPRGIDVVLVNPGPVRTASFPHGNLGDGMVLRSEQIASAIVTAVARGTPEIFRPRWYRAFPVLAAVAPPFLRGVLGRFAARTPPATG